MSTPHLQDALSDRLDALADPKSSVPPMVLIYAIDQGYLKSLLVRRKWIVKLCCMAPGEEHILDDIEAHEGDTRPDLGWYCLNDFGSVTAPILDWFRKHEKALKLIPKAGKIVEWVFDDKWSTYLKDITKASDVTIPKSALPPNTPANLPDSSLLRLVGIDRRDYRILEGQGLVFLQAVFDQHEPCGNLSPLTYGDRQLWVCSRHLQVITEQRATQQIAHRDELVTRYLAKVEQQVSTVRILGDSAPRKLHEVFVNLTLTTNREWPSSETQATYMGLMDAELRRRRNPLSAEYGEGEERLVKGRTVQPEELLKNHRRAIIVGAPGSGKSTLMRYLAYHTLKGNESLPVFLELKSITKNTFHSARGDLLSVICSLVVDRLAPQSESDAAVMKAELVQRAKNGRLSIFLDGLDEVSATVFFNDLRHLVKEFLGDSDYKQVPVFISTRPYALKDRFSQDEAEELEIEAFTQEEIGRFVTHYYPNDPQAHRLLSELKARPELRELARVPALLGFLLLLYRKQKTAPENRIDLYNEVLHQLVSQWDHEKGIERAFRTTDIRRRDFLSHLAFARLITGQKPTLSASLVFSGPEILDEAERYCESKRIPNQADLLAEDVKATALLSQVGTDSYAFAHLTIQEYLAATTLAKDIDCSKHFCRAYFDPILSELEVLPMTLVMGNRAEELVSLLTELAESVDFKRLRLKARSLRYGSVPETVLTELAELLKQMVTSEEVEFGYFAAVVKSFRGASSHAADVIAAAVAGELTNEAEVYRKFAVRVLGFLENEAATRLIKTALQDTDRSVRVEAALFISINENGAAVDNLVDELKSVESDVKEEAIYALWQIGTEKAIEGLKIAVQDTDKFVRGLALEALSNLTDTEAVPILIAHRNDADPWVRNRVVTELGDIGGESVVDALIGAAQDSDTHVAQEAIRWLGHATVERAFDFLLDFLERDHGILTGDAAEALGKIGNATAINRLYALLETYKIHDSERDPLSYFSGGWIKDYVRVRAARALLRLGDQGGKPVLLELLSEADVGERKYAAYALKDLGGIEIQSLLTKKFSNAQDEGEQITLANCLLDLGATDQPLILNRMTSILNSNRGSRSHVIGAINVLGRLTDNGTVQALTKALAENSDVFVRIAAMTALGNVGTESELAVEQLLKGLIGVNAISQTSARVLAKMSHAALAGGLHLCLESDWKYVRRKAAQTIAYYTSESRIEDELSALVDTDAAARVREVAYEALSQIRRRRWAV